MTTVSSGQTLTISSGVHVNNVDVLSSFNVEMPCASARTLSSFASSLGQLIRAPSSRVLSSA